jgi:hypothetical protein
MTFGARCAVRWMRVVAAEVCAELRVSQCAADMMVTAQKANLFAICDREETQAGDTARLLALFSVSKSEQGNSTKKKQGLSPRHKCQRRERQLNSKNVSF